MARQESDREDLLQEATALVWRVEYQGPGDQVVVVGLRANDAGSIYFDAEPVFHFNDRHELRRAYWDGRLWKAEDGMLVSLKRQRSDHEVILQRSTLDAEAQLQWLSDAQQAVRQFYEHLVAGDWQLTGAVPDAAAVEPRIMPMAEANRRRSLGDCAATARGRTSLEKHATGPGRGAGL